MRNIQRENRRIISDLKSNVVNTVQRGSTSLIAGIATVISIQAGSITVRFTGDNFDTPGIQVPSGITVSVTDKVRLVNLSNTFQSSAWKVDSIF